MILFYIRHGDPVYKPNQLTPLGERQAEALAKRLALYGVDLIYSSPSNRAVMTAKPTCELLKQEAVLLDFTDESLVYRDFAVTREDGIKKTWVFQHPDYIGLFSSKELRDMGDGWYGHPQLREKPFKEGIERVCRETDAWLSTLGYVHERYTGKYRIESANDQRIALFAHQGFGLAFLSCLLDIPYPAFCTHFDMCHTGMTVIEFQENGDYAIPKILTLSSDGHLYREGLPTKYNNAVYF